MPHKHTRKDGDKSTLDLPPNVIAKPLSVQRSAKANGIFTRAEESNAGSRRVKKRKRGNGDGGPGKQGLDDDDTPREFARLMAFTQGKRYRKGPDDGVEKPTTKTKKNNKRRKAGSEGAKASNGGMPSTKESTQATKNGAGAGAEAASRPTIRPGEKMSDFAARVDAALPLSGLLNKAGGAAAGKDPLLAAGVKGARPRTRTERRLHRMYDEWRADDERIRARRQEALEEAEAEADEADELAGGGGGEGGSVKWKVDMAAAADRARRKKAKGKGKRSGGGAGEDARAKDDDDDDDDDADPWAALARRRDEAPRSLHDVAQAPPQFTSVPRERFKVRAGARVRVDDVPKASGSLRRREVLGELRQDLLKAYRASRSGGGGTGSALGA